MLFRSYRMSNVIAGIGRGQLRVLDQRVAKKRYIYEYYRKALSGLEGIGFMPVREWNKPNFWLSCITRTGRMRPLDVMLALEVENIESRPVWKPMHLQPLLRQYEYYAHKPQFSVSDQLFAQGLCLPSGSSLSEADQQRVIDCVLRRLGEARMTVPGYAAQA